jgi:hypothetical protein
VEVINSGLKEGRVETKTVFPGRSNADWPGSETMKPANIATKRKVEGQMFIT